ncbi:SRPBCC family protein [Phenylobacterium sp.]|uniref:SRPBCC family protein n=1 Tax=Phenylobacterium sp. TaxID=1871053 RepID=UPI003D29BD7C
MTDLTVTHSYPHPPHRVFDAWLDPAVARRFLFATPSGEMIKTEIDARVGGRFLFIDRRPEMGDVEHVGEYLVIDHPRRLVFTFAVPAFDPGVTIVEVEITPTASGCDVRLTQRDTPGEWAERSAQGWATILQTLESALV